MLAFYNLNKYRMFFKSSGFLCGISAAFKICDLIFSGLLDPNYQDLVSFFSYSIMVWPKC
jgi:hypothetical protein